MSAELLLVALALAAVLIGVTGAWSPCGLSMVETIGPSGHTGGLKVTTAALITFLPGALIGGVLTFGSLAALGSLLHAGGAGGGSLAYLLAAAIAIAAALAEARGLPILPQIRRQLPEHWRRVMPMPVAAGLYGILLGLGFTTFVLSFGVWALAGISFAVADPATGALIGLAFGAGRALPILTLAPVCDRPSGRRATDAMTQNPALYRGARAGDAAALGLVAAALIAVAPQAGATNGAATYLGSAGLTERGAGDPGKQGGDIVFQRAKGAVDLARGEPLGRGGAGLLRAGQRIGLGGSVPAVGGSYIALRRADSVVLLDRERLTELARVEGPTSDALAVGPGRLVERVREASGDRLQVRRIQTTGGAAARDTVSLGEARVIARSRRPAQIGRPSLSATTVLYSLAGPKASRLLATRVNGQDRRMLFAGRLATFANPAALGGRLAYVRTTRERQEIRVRGIDARGPGRLVHVRPATSRRDPDHGRGRNRIPTRDRPPSLLRDPWTIWTLALAPRAVFATLIRQREGRPQARIMRFPLG